MQTIEDKEVRGISIKQLIYYGIMVISLITGLVYRDVKRENVVETMAIKLEALQIRNEAQDKEREAIKITDQTQETRLNSQDNRIVKLETVIELKK